MTFRPWKSARKFYKTQKSEYPNLSTIFVCNYLNVFLIIKFKTNTLFSHRSFFSADINSRLAKILDLLGSHASCYNMWKAPSGRVPLSGWLKWYDNFSADTQRALEALERLQVKLKERGETPTQEKLSLLRIVLQSPLFHHILSLQQAQRKPLAKVVHKHGCVGVGWIVNAREEAGIMSKKQNAGTKLDE